MPRQIPFTGAPKESMTVALAGRKILIRSRYANLTDLWTLDLFDTDGEEVVALVHGVVVAMGVDMLRPYRLGLGGLYAEPNATPRREAGRGELGNRVRLVHYTEDELEAL